MTAAASISVRKLYKIFGTDPKTALAHVKAGMGKAELMQRHHHVLGLHDIDIEMAAGEITVIMGLSGSGKSTLIRHLNRLIEPTAGEIWVDGENVLTFGEERLRALRRTKMSMVFQHFALLPHRTVLENAIMPLRVRGIAEETARPEGARWLARVGLAGFENRYPGQLSGGMQQRVGIARALTSGCDVMLMDEAFSALDPIIRTDMQTLLLELQKELRKTIVFITHDLDEALRLADQMVVLKDGGIVQKGEPQSIVLKPADAYIENFVRDVNRARVLLVRSVMTAGATAADGIGIDAEDTLEEAIRRARGNPAATFAVASDGRPCGALTMAQVLAALSPG